MYKKLIYWFLFSLFFFNIVSCGTLQSVKRGLTGEKENSIDEFLIEKKDPLVLPPDYENLPSPDERIAAIEENKIFKKIESENEESSSGNSTLENSILKKIKKK